MIAILTGVLEMFLTGEVPVREYLDQHKDHDADRIRAHAPPAAWHHIALGHRAIVEQGGEVKGSASIAALAPPATHNIPCE